MKKYLTISDYLFEKGFLYSIWFVCMFAIFWVGFSYLVYNLRHPELTQMQVFLNFFDAIRFK